VARTGGLMPRLSRATLPAVQAAIAAAGMDGWLLYDFRGINAIAGELIGVEGLATRRVFAWVPRDGVPVAMQHTIEPGPLRHWPAEWPRRMYVAWRELEEHLAALVHGKRVAMEYSAGDAVPVLDRVPAGVVEMVRAAGATVVSSAPLVTGAFATWTSDDVASHTRAAEQLARIAANGFRHIAEGLKAGRPVFEHEVFADIRAAFAAAGLDADHGPIVAAGANAADPHYEPSAAAPRAFGAGDVALIDLFAHEPDGMWADQTWMAVVGAPTDRQQLVWNTIRDARDTAVAHLHHTLAAGDPVAGADVDRVTRDVVARAGFGAWFTHRTGHSIDRRGLHGAGPNLDNLETRDDRVLMPGCGFSIEPGIYLPNEFGMRTEVNGYITTDGQLVVTPTTVQQALVIIGDERSL
jgi:Xaa-Pro dipeptidase